jgi:hypothetical protein
MAVDPQQGFLVSGSLLDKMRAAMAEIASLKQQVKQVQSQYLPGLPMEIIVPRSYDDEDEIYTVDVYVYDPASSTYVLKLENQTAELMPDSL